MQRKNKNNSNNNRKIYVVGYGDNYANWMEGEITKDFDEANLICFTGGADVSPSLYGKLSHPTTCCSPMRDREEVEIFHRAQKAGKHMIGICRGSQLLCVLSGGILVQHQENNHFYHEINTYDNQNIMVTSTHHQAAYPFYMDKSNYKILGWTQNLSNFHFGEDYGDELSPPKECEIVYYPKTKCLGIQSHPESLFGEPYDEAIRSIAYCQGLLNAFMMDKL